MYFILGILFQSFLSYRVNNRYDNRQCNFLCTINIFDTCTNNKSNIKFISIVWEFSEHLREQYFRYVCILRNVNYWFMELFYLNRFQKVFSH